MTHDQTEGRHIIWVPMPFTEKGLKFFIAHMNGWEDQPDVVDNFADAIINAGRVDLNPSSALGEGANIVDTFSFGLMALAKQWNIPAPDINDLWVHPMRNKLTTEILSIEIKEVAGNVESNEDVITDAIDASTGNLISAYEVSGSCPGNKDNLER